MRLIYYLEGIVNLVPEPEQNKRGENIKRMELLNRLFFLKIKSSLP